MARTKSMIRSNVWFPGINEKVEHTVRKCLACQAVTPAKGPFEPLRMSPMLPGAWQNLSMDFCCPLPTGDYLMVLIDEYSQYPISATTIMPVLAKVLSTYSGSPFNSYAFAQFSKYSGFEHRCITPQWT